MYHRAILQVHKGIKNCFTIYQFSSAKYNILSSLLYADTGDGGFLGLVAYLLPSIIYN